ASPIRLRGLPAAAFRMAMPRLRLEGITVAAWFRAPGEQQAQPPTRLRPADRYRLCSPRFLRAARRRDVLGFFRSAGRVAETRRRFGRGLDPDAFRLGIGQQRLLPRRAAVTRAAEAAEGRADIDRLVAVHPEGAGADRRRHA